MTIKYKLFLKLVQASPAMFCSKQYDQPAKPMLTSISQLRCWFLLSRSGISYQETANGICANDCSYI